MYDKFAKKKKSTSTAKNSTHNLHEQSFRKQTIQCTIKQSIKSIVNRLKLFLELNSFLAEHCTYIFFCFALSPRLTSPNDYSDISNHT